MFGWECVNEGVLLNILEVIDIIVWFGFKDDVVICLIVKSDDILVDICSKLWVGKSDLGKNVECIEIFMVEFRN